MESHHFHQSKGFKKRILDDMKCGSDNYSSRQVKNRLNSVLSAAIGLTSLGTAKADTVSQGPTVGCSLDSPSNLTARAMLGHFQPPQQVFERNQSCVNDLVHAQATYYSEPHPMNGKNFPQVLFEIVTDERNADVISWLHHGQGFMIHDKSRFSNEILPRFFDGTKFTSFTRRLKRWNFTRTSRGPELGAYYNRHFSRGKPSNVHKMRYRITLENRALAKKKEAKIEKAIKPQEHSAHVGETKTEEAEKKKTTERQDPPVNRSTSTSRSLSPEMVSGKAAVKKQVRSSQDWPLGSYSPVSVPNKCNGMHTIMNRNRMGLDQASHSTPDQGIFNFHNLNNSIDAPKSRLPNNATATTRSPSSVEWPLGSHRSRPLTSQSSSLHTAMIRNKTTLDHNACRESARSRKVSDLDLADIHHRIALNKSLALQELANATARNHRDGHPSKNLRLGQYSLESVPSESQVRNFHASMIRNEMSLDRKLSHDSAGSYNASDQIFGLHKRALMDKSFALGCVEAKVAEDSSQLVAPFSPSAVNMQRPSSREYDQTRDPQLAAPFSPSAANMQQRQSSREYEQTQDSQLAAPFSPSAVNMQRQKSRDYEQTRDHKAIINAAMNDLRSRMGVSTLYRNRDNGIPRSGDIKRKFPQHVSAIDAEECSRNISPPQNCYRASAA